MILIYSNNKALENLLQITTGMYSFVSVWILDAMLICIGAYLGNLYRSLNLCFEHQHTVQTKSGDYNKKVREHIDN